MKSVGLKYFINLLTSIRFFTLYFRLAEDEISNDFDFGTPNAGSDRHMKNEEIDDFFDSQDIKYSEKEIEGFRSIKNIFVNRKQFKYRAMINSPAYKLKQKEIEREKYKNSKLVSRNITKI